MARLGRLTDFPKESIRHHRWEKATSPLESHRFVSQAFRSCDPRTDGWLPLLLDCRPLLLSNRDSIHLSLPRKITYDQAFRRFQVFSTKPGRNRIRLPRLLYPGVRLFPQFLSDLLRPRIRLLGKIIDACQVCRICTRPCRNRTRLLDSWSSQLGEKKAVRNHLISPVSG